MVTLLIEHGADANVVNSLNNSALILAISKGNLIEKFQNIVQKKLKKAILFCIEFDKAAELLIKNGADVNVAGQHGQTALICAAEKGKKNYSKLFPTVYFPRLR